MNTFSAGNNDGYSAAVSYTHLDVYKRQQLDKRNGVTTGGNDKDVADNAAGNSGKDNGKTRKKSDKNMDNYRKIVIADDSEVEQRYKSDYRRCV